MSRKSRRKSESDPAQPTPKPAGPPASAHDNSAPHGDESVPASWRRRAMFLIGGTVLVFLPAVWAATVIPLLPRDARTLLIATALLTPWVVPAILAATVRPGLRGILLPSAATGLLFWAAFPPVGWWPLILLAPAPWCVAMARRQHAMPEGAGADRFIASTAMAQCLFGGVVYWVVYPTEWGWAGVTVQATLHTVAGCAALWWLRGVSGLPWAVLLPVVWTAADWSRSVGEISYPWVFVGHALAPFPIAIQVADIGGVYIVGFAASMAGGLAADLWSWRQPETSSGQDGSAPDGRSRPGDDAASAPPRAAGLPAFPLRPLIATAATWVFVLGYGAWRLAETADAATQGPSVMTLQTNMPQYVKEELVAAQEKQHIDYFAEDFARALAGARESVPEMILWPETASPAPLNRSFVARDFRSEPGVVGTKAEEFFRERQNLAAYILRLLGGLSRTGGGSAIVIGHPGEEWVRGDRRWIRRGRNSVLFVRPEAPAKAPPGSAHAAGDAAAKDGSAEPDSIVFRRADGPSYDKTRLVPFGEYIPFRETLPWLHAFFLNFTPGGMDISTVAGRIGDYRPFTLAGRDGRTWRFAAPVCFEDTLADHCRALVWDPATGEKRCDFLVNLSNDGWFEGSSELDLHLAIACFRAVENRVGLVRSANTGGSAFVDTAGRVRGRVTVGGADRLVAGWSTERVWTDRRTTLYGAWGDWWGGLCFVTTGALLLRYRFARRPTR